MSQYSNHIRKQYGIRAKRGKAAEFDKLAEKLYFLNSECTFTGLYDPNGEFQKKLAERDAVLAQIMEISSITK